MHEEEEQEDMQQAAAWCMRDQARLGNKSRGTSKSKTPRRRKPWVAPRREQEPLGFSRDRRRAELLVDQGPRSERFALMLPAYQRGILQQEASARGRRVSDLIGEALRDWVTDGRRWWIDAPVRHNDSRVDLTLTAAEKGFLAAEAQSRGRDMSAVVLTALDAWFRVSCAEYQGGLWEWGGLE